MNDFWVNLSPGRRRAIMAFVLIVLLAAAFGGPGWTYGALAIAALLAVVFVIVRASRTDAENTAERGDLPGWPGGRWWFVLLVAVTVVGFIVGAIAAGIVG